MKFGHTKTVVIGIKKKKEKQGQQLGTTLVKLGLTSRHLPKALREEKVKCCERLEASFLKVV